MDFSKAYGCHTFASKLQQIKVMKNHLFVLSLMLFSLVAFGQEKRTNPKHPKGNTAMQMKALVHYNEAVDYYDAGNIGLAKRSLKKAINTDFALTEAQLFLADILYDQGVKDSALYYYVSGCDFIIEQEPRYYFRLMECGMELGEYEIVKQHVKRFKKLYAGKVEIGPYEKDYPYTVEDYNYYRESIDLIYNYKSWQPEFEPVQGEKPITIENIKRENTFVSKDESLKLLINEESGSRQLLVQLKSSKKWNAAKPIAGLDQYLNSMVDPFYMEDKKLFYFSALVDGHYDLFVAKLDLEKMQMFDVRPLNRINTKGNERFPFFFADTFYFSSNGYPGFGGMDIFYTPDNESIDGFLFPVNQYNMLTGVNSNLDELNFYCTLFGQASLIRKEDGEYQNLKLIRSPKKEGLVYKITIEDLDP